MKLPMDVTQTVAGDMGVNFRGADVRVAEQFLDHAQVCAMLQQVRGKAMAQHVWRDVARHPGTFYAGLDVRPHRDGSERAAAIGEKNIRRRTRFHEFRSPRC